MNNEIQEASISKETFNNTNEDFNAFLNNTKPSENFQNYQQNQAADNDYEVICKTVNHKPKLNLSEL